MSDKKLPSVADGRALAGQRAAEIEQRLKEMRGELAALPKAEVRTVRYVYAVTGKRFGVLYRRELPSDK